MKEERSCKNCRFEVMMECHYFPPHPKYGWPKIKQGEWCGKWEDWKKGKDGRSGGISFANKPGVLGNKK